MCTLTLLGDHGTFVVQRCRSSPPNVGYNTLEKSLNKEEMEAMCAMCTCRRGFKILINEEIDSFSLK